jgi:hypothetical protein
MKIGKKWLRMAEIYRRFARDYPQSDISDAAAMAMYLHETFGEPMPKAERLNGFEIGKKLMDVTVAGWKEDIPQLGLIVSEIQADGYPDWFLERVGVLNLAPTLDACAWFIEMPNA